MITSGLPQPRDESTPLSTHDLRQGDVVTHPSLPLLTGTGECDWNDTSDGVVILSQTCDLVRASPPSVIVARVVRLKGEDARLARDGRRPRYVHIPEYGEDSFADLEAVASMQKRYLATLPRTHGVASDEDVSRFGKLIGRRFSRFPFPDEVVYWLQPLEDVVRSKYSKPNSAEGRLFAEVSELRIQSSSGWDRPPYALTLIVILKPMALPTFPDDQLPDFPATLRNWIYPNHDLRDVDSLAQKLETSTDPVERYWLWQAVGEAWARKCRPRPKILEALSPDEAQRTRTAIQDDEIQYEVLTEDDFPMSRYIRSEMLDLDHLSPTSPMLVYPLDGLVNETGVEDADIDASAGRATSGRRSWRRWKRSGD